MNRYACLLSFALLLSPALADEPVAPVTTASAAQRDVDLVIALDTSGSMQGLIEACRKKIWDVCTLLAQARPEPTLRVALVSFGSNDAPENGHVVLRHALTEELDLVYERLFKLQAAGGTELVGKALRVSLDQLQWSQQPGALKLLVIAGNESADQDRQHPFRELAQEALQREITVHAVYCGGDEDSDAQSWRELARFGGGRFASIDQGGTVSVVTPYDEELTKLGISLNDTYLPYGSRGAWGAANQRAQDKNAADCDPGTAAARAGAKALRCYQNDSWDLVDRSAQQGFKWSELKDEALPKALQGKTEPEKQAYVDALRAKRAELQERVKALNTRRQKYVADELAKREDAKRSLDFVLAEAIKAEAKELGFRWE